MRIGVLVALLAITATTAVGEPRDEIGLVRLSSYTSVKELGDPDGWGIYFRHDFSTRFSAQVAWSGFSNQYSEIVTVPEDSSRIWSNLTTELNFLTVGLACDLVDDGEMALTVGVNGGMVFLEQVLRPFSLAFMPRTDDARAMIEGDVSFMVRRLGSTPFGLRLGFRSRRIDGAAENELIYGDLQDAFTISNIEAGLMWRF